MAGPRYYQVYFDDRLVARVPIFPGATNEQIENSIRQFLQRDDLIFNIHHDSSTIRVYSA